MTSQIEALRTVSSVEAAQSESGLPLSESQVLAIADALAKGQGFLLDEYSTPTIEHKEGVWTVLFERKEAPASGPRGYFWVTVVDADGDAELRRGPW